MDWPLGQPYYHTFASCFSEMADNKLKRIDSFQYPLGHLGHLSVNQQAALDRFKELCREKEYYKPAAVDESTSPSHDDETLL